MGLEIFQAAFDALPEGADNEDISDFLAGVAVSYMPPEEAMRALLIAAKRVAEYDQATDDGEVDTTECNCPNCTARRAERVHH